jgi:hypothetical protein
MLNFMRRFLARLDQRGFNPQAKLCETVLSTYKALDRAHMDFDCRACGDNVGRSPDED